MPVPTETLRNMKKLNLVFAAVSVLTLVVMLWMLKHDFDRKWRGFQTDYFDLRSAMAHFTALAYDSPKERETHARLVAAVEAAEAALATDEARARAEALKSRTAEIEGELAAANIAFGNLNAEIQVTAFDEEESRTLHGPDDPRTQAAHEKYEAQKKALAGRTATKDALTDQLALAKAESKAFFKAKNDARKALDGYEKGRRDALRDEDMYGPGYPRSVFNLPGLDFLAPTGTPGREEIRQVYMADVRFNYNFLDSYQTDRCITCHVGMNDPHMTEVNFVRQGEKAVHSRRVAAVVRERNNELRKELLRRLAGVQPMSETGNPAELEGDERATLVRRGVREANAYMEEIGRPALDADRIVAVLDRGDGPLTFGRISDAILDRAQRIFAVARPKRPGGSQDLDYLDMSPPQRQDYAQSLLAALNDYLEHEGRPRIKLEKVLMAHPNLDLYVGAKSPHPMKSMGCTVCHEGSGQDTDFILAAHTPRDHEQEERWAERYGEKELGVPLASFHLVEEYWEHPMFPADYISASCTKCHDRAMDLERSRTRRMMSDVPATDGAGERSHRVERPLRMVEGRHLFTSLGCINCHKVDSLSDSRRVGPDLSHVAEKLDAGFMQRWIEYPNNFRPSTRMPHFFRQENNLPPSANEFDPDPVLRTETEIQAITHYLRTFSTSYDPEPLPEGVEGDAARGKQLFVSIGCLACHVNLAAHDPTDEDGRTFGERWITTELRMVDGASAADAKARYESMSGNDRVRFAMRRFEPFRREQAMSAAKAEEVAADSEGREPDERRMYVPPAFTRFGPEFSGIGTKLVPDAGDSEQRLRGRTWLYNWLKNPRHYSSTTKMPRLFKDNYYWKLPADERRAAGDRDILDIAAYLLSLRNDDFDRTAFSDDARHRAEAEQLIRVLLGGQNTASVTERLIRDEKATASQPYGGLTRAIVQQTYKSFGGGEAGRKRVAGIVMRQDLAQRQKLFLGLKMVTHYGCYACHVIPGFEDATRPGTDMTTWGQKFITQLDFAFYAPPFKSEIERQPEVFGKLYRADDAYAHLRRDVDDSDPRTTNDNSDTAILHNHAAFAYHKVRNPRIWDRAKVKKPYDKLKMPNFFLTDEEARSLVTFLLSRRDPWVTDAVKIDYDNTPAGKIAAGRALVRELNCIGCHAIEAGQGNIHQYYVDDPSLEDDNPIGARFKPPLLWGEGAKVQPRWLHTFLDHVQMLRPWLKVRMPSFSLTSDQRKTLVEYFVGLAQDESQMLDEQIRPVLAHLAAARSASDGQPRSVGTDGNAVSGSDWFVADKFADSAALLGDWAVAHHQITPYDLQPGPDADEAARIESLAPTFGTVLRRSSFLSDLLDIDYPFPRTEATGLSDDRFKLGEKLFYNQRCLSCHVAGDPGVPGTTTAIKAPNFALAHERLRYDWILNWLRDPQAIQPGANMPQIFQGGDSAFATLAPEEREKLEGEFGSTMDAQARLLVDFLFELGDRRYTAIQPGAALEQEVPEQDEEEEMDFDFEEEDAKPDAEEEFDF